ncbi:MAG: DNA-binding response regulator [Bdellovibrio sp.]|nr:MAG: DNA-binding response regulator [Bdellovibrio sp.]
MEKNEVRVLIIDDEVLIRQTLRLNLRSAGFTIAEAADGKLGIEKVGEFHPHLVILDLGLPDMNGLDVLKALRQWTRVPIIILTVVDEEEAKVRLLDAGADDYLTKPFGKQELLARTRVALRNSGMIEATPVFESGELTVDLSQRKVSRLGHEVKLTFTEFEVLARLVRARGKVVPSAILLKQVWGSTAEDQGQYLRIYINQLRKKIESNPSSPQHILTETGVGYRIV